MTSHCKKCNSYGCHIPYFQQIQENEEELQYNDYGANDKGSTASWSIEKYGSEKIQGIAQQLGVRETQCNHVTQVLLKEKFCK